MTAERGNGSTWDRCQSGSGNLYVVLRRVEARPDGTDHLAIHDGGKPALHLGKTLRGDGSQATTIYRVLKRQTRLLEQRSCRSLAGCQFHTGKIGRMVHALDQDGPPPPSTTATTPAR